MDNSIRCNSNDMIELINQVMKYVAVFNSAKYTLPYAQGDMFQDLSSKCMKPRIVLNTVSTVFILHRLTFNKV